MGKYAQYERNKKPQATHKIHPVWTGIGFLMIIIVPVMTWAAATVLVDFGKSEKWFIIRQFPPYLQIPDMVVQIIPGLFQVTKMQNLPATLTFFFFMLIVFSAVFSVLYAALYRVVGPPRYGPDDIPAPKIKTKTFKR